MAKPKVIACFLLYFPYIKRYMQLLHMRKLLLLLSLIPISIFGQDISNSVGVLTISDEYDNTDHIINFLNEDGTTWYTLNLYEDWKNKEDFSIIAFKPDYFLFKIRCKEQTSDGFRVVVNEETGLTKKLANSDKVKLISWEQYALDVFSVDFNPIEHPIYDKIDGALILELPKRKSIMVPKEINGEWMQIIWSDTNDYPSNITDDRTGWIRWRKNNQIVIKVYHLS